MQYQVLKYLTQFILRFCKIYDRIDKLPSKSFPGVEVSEKSKKGDERGTYMQMVISRIITFATDVLFPSK